MKQQHNEFKILTIGQIAYYESQISFIDHLANRDDFLLSFIGDGPASKPLQRYVQDQNISNVTFGGRYQKIDETSIVESYHMINIWLKPDVNADSCMANRFYLSTQLRKPMIVRKGSYQGELCEQYHLGVALDESEDYDEKIKEWWGSFNSEIYDKGCREFLSGVRNDIERLESHLVKLFQEEGINEL